MLRARMFRSLIPVLMIKEQNIRARNITILPKDCRLYYEIGGFLSNFPVPFFETHPIKFYGKEKHNAKVFSIYLSKFDEKSQNYLLINVHVKWSLGEFKMLT